jgi:hypothetical protein
MDTEIKAELCKRLESGEYKQGTARLRRQSVTPNAVETWCCLGVLVDIVEPESWSSTTYGTYSSHGLDAFPTQEILKKAALKHDEAETLYKMNDSTMSFPQIANYIKENL